MSEEDEDQEFAKALEIVHKKSKTDPDKARQVKLALSGAMKIESLITEAENYTKKLVDVFNSIAFSNFNEDELENYIRIVKRDIKKYSGRFSSV